MAANGIVDGYIRPIAWRGSEQLGIGAPDTRVRVAIAAWEWPSYFSPEKKLAGLRLTISRWTRPGPQSAPTDSKASGLYVISTLAKHEALAAGYDDALMLDWRGLVAEATGANIFFVIDGALHTPLPECFLDGITRRTVIELARRRGIVVVERSMKMGDLNRASEAFLTGTAAEITPIREIGDVTYQPSWLSQTLVEDYHALVRN